MKQHPDDPTLVSLLDGELDAPSATAARGHLESCWTCRRRAALLEEQMSDIARTFGAAAFTDPLWMERGAKRLTTKSTEQDSQPKNPLRWLIVAAAATLLAATSAIQSSHGTVAPVVIHVSRPAALPHRFTTPAPITDRFPAPVRTRRSVSSVTLQTSATELDDAELGARYALFKVKADLGEPLRVVIEDGAVLVTGIIEPPERRNEIEAVLAELPNVRSELQPAQLSDPPAEAQSSERVVVELPVIEPELRDYLGRSADRRNATVFANLLIERTSKALDHAWAVRRIEDAFPPDRVQKLSNSARWLLEAMVLSHTEAAGEYLSQVASDVTPFLQSLSRRSERETADDKQLLELADQVNRDIFSLFAASTVDERADPQTKIARVLNCLAGLRHALAQTGERWTLQTAGKRRTP